MGGIARLGDPISGITSGEHTSHEHPCLPTEITGFISGGCSTKVFIEGKPAAVVGSETTEYDSCCGMSHGSVGSGSGKVRIGGIFAARIGDPINAHNGTAYISGGSSKVKSN